MADVKEIFTDSKLVVRIKEKLPKLFHIAELECARAGKKEVADYDTYKRWVDYWAE